MPISTDHKDKLLPRNVDVTIDGRTLILKPITENEINERYLSWLNDPENNQFLETRHKKQTMVDIYEYINGLRSMNGCEVFAIFLKKNNSHVGNIAIMHFNVNHQGLAVYGAFIADPSLRMLGAGAEAEVSILEFLFRHPEIRKVKAGAYEDNFKSWQLLENLGFKREATLRKEAIMGSSKISDVYLYGILREEWMGKRKKLSFLLDNVNILDQMEMKDAIKN
jgi:[ribosomal protein S5]-alanine N-acetyltransferase